MPSPVSRIRREKFTFPNPRGESLAALAEYPVTPPRAWVLFAHCFTCSKQVGAATRISRALAGHGFGVLRFDFTGLGNSEGDFANTNFTSNVDDLRAAAEYLRAHHSAPAILIGHSLGGAAVLGVAGDLPEVRAVVTIGAPCDPQHVLRLFAPALDEIEARGEATVDIGGRPFRIKRQLVEDLRRQDLAGRIAALRRPLLILHSPRDRVVGIDQARCIYEHARHPKSFVSLDTADHMLSDPRDAEYVAGLLTAWAGRYVPAPAPASPAPDDDEEVLVREVGGEYLNEIRVRGHRFYADEPLDVGGQDGGPKPTEYLLAALGSCISITLRMYVRHKGFPVDEIAVRLRQLPGGRDEPTRLRVQVQLRGAVDDAQLKRIGAIARRCPVHRILTGPVEVEHGIERVG